MKKEQLVEPIINIARISTISMHYNLQIPNNKAFTTSLYKIDSILKQWGETLLGVIIEELTIPNKYTKYANIFLKAASNILPPY